MTDEPRNSSQPLPEPPERGDWEPMDLRRVGAFGDVLRGATGTFPDTGATYRRSLPTD